MMSDRASTSTRTSRDGGEPCAEKLREIGALISAFPKGNSNDGQKPPDSALGTALKNMVIQWNSLLSQVVTEVDHPQPILEHIKETAEFSVKQFRDACLAMNSELTRISMDWQLNFPEEMVKQEIAEYENSIRRQEDLLTKISQKLDEEISSGENSNFGTNFGF
uniref:Uncharacterized protein n=1 Tax=Globodera rostochiensis TaxID=31243 RepID=A0A914HGA8_GLORO